MKFWKNNLDKLHFNDLNHTNDDETNEPIYVNVNMVRSNDNERRESFSFNPDTIIRSIISYHTAPCQFDRYDMITLHPAHIPHPTFPTTNKTTTNEK